MSLSVNIVRNVAARNESPSMRRYADELALALKLYEPQIRVHETKPARIPWPRLPGVRVPRGIFSYTYRYFLYPRQVGARHADVHHITEVAAAHVIRRLDPRRTVVTCHDLMGARHLREGALAPALSEIATRYSLSFLPRAAAVVADSENTRRDLLGRVSCDPERVHVVHPGVGDHFCPGHPSSRQRRQHNEARPRALHVGMTLDYKNIPGILHTLSLLRRERGIAIDLIKVGSAFTREQEQLIDRLNLTDAVRYVGHLDEAQLVEAYRSADFLFFPSLYEGFGWPIVEAMACGLPVVTSNRGSIPEVVGDAAAMAEPGNHAGLADAIQRILMDDGYRAHLVEKGLARASRFTWSTCARQLRVLYDDILAAA